MRLWVEAGETRSRSARVPTAGWEGCDGTGNPNPLNTDYFCRMDNSTRAPPRGSGGGKLDSASRPAGRLGQAALQCQKAGCCGREVRPVTASRPVRCLLAILADGVMDSPWEFETDCPHRASGAALVGESIRRRRSQGRRGEGFPPTPALPTDTRVDHARGVVRSLRMLNPACGGAAGRRFRPAGLPSPRGRGYSAPEQQEDSSSRQKKSSATENCLRCWNTSNCFETNSTS